jgi:hypothetical protein
MNKPLIELIMCESGDWEVLRMNLGEYFLWEGHSISNQGWIILLEKLGFKVVTKDISDEEMEYRSY